ncbi:hypothetical protein THIOM_002144 [Candidatus Thiomargarita nelsonii]|uniref:Uncharacterized protein n=1 Tax=Candidatus Thiomargarita nelsonii TaxID=1003181 RepID=A0A176S1X1_9GAMM|nr:hypothetical protein THIOM_002144 [Candidatus Thiomargarita nelsonii]
MSNINYAIATSLYHLDFIVESVNKGTKMSIAWVVLIESHKKINSDEKDARYGCDTKFKGLIVRDDGKVFLNPEVNGGSGCPPIDRGRLAYISLAHDYVHIRE